VQFVPYVSCYAVKLPLSQNNSHRSIQYILQGLNVDRASTVENTVAIVDIVIREYPQLGVKWGEVPKLAYDSTAENASSVGSHIQNDSSELILMILMPRRESIIDGCCNRNCFYTVSQKSSHL